MLKYLVLSFLLITASIAAYAQGISLGLGMNDLLSTQAGTPAPAAFILLEAGGKITLEAGGNLQCENC